MNFWPKYYVIAVCLLISSGFTLELGRYTVTAEKKEVVITQSNTSAFITIMDLNIDTLIREVDGFVHSINLLSESSLELEMQIHDNRVLYKLNHNSASALSYSVKDQCLSIKISIDREVDTVFFIKTLNGVNVDTILQSINIKGINNSQAKIKPCANVEDICISNTLIKSGLVAVTNGFEFIIEGDALVKKMVVVERTKSFSSSKEYLELSFEDARNSITIEDHEKVRISEYTLKYKK